MAVPVYGHAERIREPCCRPGAVGEPGFAAAGNRPDADRPAGRGRSGPRCMPGERGFDAGPNVECNRRHDAGQRDERGGQRRPALCPRRPPNGCGGLDVRRRHAGPHYQIGRGGRHPPRKIRGRPEDRGNNSVRAMASQSSEGGAPCESPSSPPCSSRSSWSGRPAPRLAASMLAPAIARSRSHPREVPVARRARTPGHGPGTVARHPVADRTPGTVRRRRLPPAARGFEPAVHGVAPHLRHVRRRDALPARADRSVADHPARTRGAPRARVVSRAGDRPGAGRPRHASAPRSLSPHRPRIRPRSVRDGARQAAGRRVQAECRGRADRPQAGRHSGPTTPGAVFDGLRARKASRTFSGRTSRPASP